MKGILPLLLLVLGVSVGGTASKAAETNLPPEETIRYLGYTPNLSPFYYPNASDGWLSGYQYWSEANLDTVIFVANDPNGPWKRFPWTFRNPTPSTRTIYFRWYFIQQDKPTFFRVAQTPDAPGTALVYFDTSSPNVLITNRYGQFTDWPVADWVTNRLVRVGYGFEPRTALDENSLPGSTNITLTWIKKEPPPPVYVPPVTTTNSSGGTNTTGGATPGGTGYTGGTGTNSTTNPGGTGIGGTGTGGTGGTGGSGGSGSTNSIPPDPNQNQPPPPAPVKVTASLNGILEDFSTKGFSDFSAYVEADAGPKYSSGGLETNQWSGTITVPTNMPLALYVRSDDGCRVTINGSVIHDSFGSGVSWTRRESSLVFLTCLAAGSVNQVVVDYSNIKKGASGDNDDGISLYVVGDYASARVTGPSAFAWFGSNGSDEMVYKLNAHASMVDWTTSPNLRIVETNEQLHTVTVVAVGESSAYWDSWVQASWYSLCGGVSTARYKLTVLSPKTLVPGPITQITSGGQVGSTYTYQIVDQFNAAFTLPCLISATVWAAQGSPPRTASLPAFKNRTPVAGRFSDGCLTPMGYQSFKVGEAVFCHRTKDANGILVGIIYLTYDLNKFFPQLSQ